MAICSLWASSSWNTNEARLNSGTNLFLLCSGAFRGLKAKRSLQHESRNEAPHRHITHRHRFLPSFSLTTTSTSKSSEPIDLSTKLITLHHQTFACIIRRRPEHYFAFLKTLPPHHLEKLLDRFPGLVVVAGNGERRLAAGEAHARPGTPQQAEPHASSSGERQSRQPVGTVEAPSDRPEAAPPAAALTASTSSGPSRSHSSNKADTSTQGQVRSADPSFKGNQGTTSSRAWRHRSFRVFLCRSKSNAAASTRLGRGGSIRIRLRRS